MMDAAERRRRSAKTVIQDLTSELLARTADPHRDAKLDCIESIAHRMGWNDLWNRIRFRERPKQPWWVEK
jgi:hypothetical protein